MERARMWIVGTALCIAGVLLVAAPRQGVPVDAPLPEQDQPESVGTNSVSGPVSAEPFSIEEPDSPADRQPVPPTTMAPTTMPPTTAAPFLTLEGYLKDRIDRSYQRPFNHKSKTASDVVKSSIYNPDRKKLSPQHLQELEELVALHGSKYLATLRAERQVRAAAERRAVARGDVISYTEADKERFPDGFSRETRRILIERFGRGNFITHTYTTMKFDGVPREDVVFMHRAAEPELFAHRDAQGPVLDAQHLALRAFMARIP